MGSPCASNRLATLFQLTPSDCDVLLICLAPELDLRYERLYAYLQDDVTQRRPTVDLATEPSLLCSLGGKKTWQCDVAQSLFGAVAQAAPCRVVR